MRATPAALLAHMAGSDTTLCTLIKITRTDGQIYGFTDHDQDVTYLTVLYVASIGMDASAVETTGSLGVGNLETRGFLTSLGVDQPSIAAGLWDYADVRVYRVNWADLTMGDEKAIRGWVGDISLGRDEFKNEVRSLAQKLQSKIGELSSVKCRADLFDARCAIVATEGVWKFSAVSVSTVVVAQRQFTAAALTQAAAFFTNGKVVWETGPNAGLAKEVKIHIASGNITLHEPMPYAFAIGNVFTIYAGCTKRYSEDCLTKFANQIRFVGEPFIPGEDALIRGPL